MKLAHLNISDNVLKFLTDKEMLTLHKPLIKNEDTKENIPIILKMEELDLAGCQKISLHGLEPLLSKMKALRILDLSKNDWVNNDVLLAIMKFTPYLRRLDVTGCSKLKEQDIKNFKENMRYCEVVNTTPKAP